MESVIEELVRKNRSYRRFYQDRRVDEQTLRELVELARLSPSAGNMQPLKFLLSADPALNARIFPTLAWAGYLRDWSGPAEGERPAAYIVIVGDKEIRPNFGCDHGIAAQSILLGAVERGLGGCMIGAIDRKALRAVLNLPEERWDILLVIALGYPKEQVVLEEVGPDGDIKYYRDAAGVHHVPKRRLDDLILPAPAAK
ncbi:MAG: nitroreductase family protein [Armatimonadota bacterium]|nr:nitroreductase family protein [Armatimonadota bacterium]